MRIALTTAFPCLGDASGAHYGRTTTKKPGPKPTGKGVQVQLRMQPRELHALLRTPNSE